MSSQLIKITFEYANGRVSTLEGPEAEKWNNEIKEIMWNDQMRSGTFSKYNFIETTRTNPN